MNGTQPRKGKTMHKPNPQTMTNQEIRSELARRIRSKRAVSKGNDPARKYRRTMNECRKGEDSYHRKTGFPWAAKDT